MIFAILTAVVMAATAPAAPPAAPVAPLDPAATAAATALVKQLDVRGQIARTMAANIAAMESGVVIRSMLAQQPGFVQAYQANKARFDPALKQAGAIQAEAAKKVVDANIDAVVAAAARAYARNFSAAELKALSDFYRTPLGTALYQKQPRVSAEIGSATAQIMGSKLEAAMQANSARLKAALAPLNAAPPSSPPALPAKK